MQRFIFLTCLTTLVMTLPAFAQQMEDVVHLKNGGLIRGTITEQIPSESLKIQTRDGNIFVYTMDEIAKISKEPVMRMRGHIGAKEKNPWLAFGLSLLIPGAGQFYNGQHDKGMFQLGVVVFHYKDCRWIHDCSGKDDLGILTLLGFGFHIWSIVDAPISADAINQQSQQPSYGHLIELRGSRATLGVDPVVSHKNLGTRLTLHF